MLDHKPINMIFQAPFFIVRSTSFSSQTLIKDGRLAALKWGRLAIDVVGCQNEVVLDPFSNVWMADAVKLGLGLTSK